MAQVELTNVDLGNLLAIINTAQIKGDSAETIALLKQKLIKAQVPEPAPVTPDPAPEAE